MKSHFTPEQQKILKAAISRTWNAIASDCQEFIEDNEGVLEMVTDADRLLTFGEDGGAANKIFLDAYQANNYEHSDAVLAEMLTWINYF